MTNLTAPHQTFHFQRFEFKYLVSRSKAEHIIEDCLKNNLKWDPFVEEFAEKKYPVTSLYFDSSGWKCYYEKIAGNKGRFKVRVRTYSETFGDGTPIFFEIKKKIDALVRKDRILLPQEEYEQAFHTEAGFSRIHQIGGARETAKEIFLKIQRFSLRPAVFITYNRMPLVGTFLDRFRITFDMDLRAARFGDQTTPSWYPLLTDSVVMEVKYNNTLPFWFHRVISAHNLQREPFSKYCNGVEKLHAFSII